MNIIETNELKKEYPSPQGIIKALDKLSITVPQGSIALLGPNGSGKSTLIKIVLGLITPTSGKYRIFGMTGDDKEIARNKMGYMPETPSIISNVNAVKFVRHFGILSGLNFTRAMQRSHEVLDYVGLGESRYREIEKYSTGMKQRLLFAQSLVHDPDVIILDEPTSGLSPEGRSEMLELISEITKDYGKSILFSTHILPDVENICNYSILLNKGKSIFQGSMKDISNMYEDTIIMEVTSKSDVVAEDLRNRGYQISFKGRSIVIENNGETSLPTLNNLRQITEPEGVEILSYRQHKPTLEDLFLNSIESDIDD